LYRLWEVIVIVNFYDIWFSKIDIENKDKIELLNKFSCKDLWNFNKKDFENLKVKEKTYSKILDKKYKQKLDKYINYMESKNIFLVSFKNKDYPDKLKNIYDMPAFLYIRGNLENLYYDNVAIVGSREATDYGKIVARNVAKELADKNINIVSGLALGIDKYAHLGALDSNIGKTIAVLGTGVADSEIYPFQNKKVFERILESNGTIISEFKLGTTPAKYNFPRRNRIISGLSEKILVVEAKENSGSLITADFALEQRKRYFCCTPEILLQKTLKELID